MLTALSVAHFLMPGVTLFLITIRSCTSVRLLGDCCEVHKCINKPLDYFADINHSVTTKILFLELQTQQNQTCPPEV